jgi:1-acyl-sn-glycerol-3-phosphate acyltransferase
MYIFYRTLKSILFIIGKIFFQFQVFGKENIPKNGGVIFASNHVSFLDPIVIAIGTKRIISFMARATLFRNIYFAFIIKKLNAFPVRRGRYDRAAIKEAAKRLTKGHGLVIFPEGTRSPDGKVQRGKAGVGVLVLEANVPVVPVYVSGTFEALAKNSKKINFFKIKIYYGKPIYLNTIDLSEAKGLKEKGQIISDIVIEEIKKIC